MLHRRKTNYAASISISHLERERLRLLLSLRLRLLRDLRLLERDLRKRRGTLLVNDINRRSIIMWNYSVTSSDECGKGFCRGSATSHLERLRLRE